MKKRIGFVSNSSSSSFIVFGCNFDFSENEDAFDAFEKISEQTNHVLKTYRYDYDYCNEYGIGLPVTDMKDSETLEQFKKRIKALIEDTLNIHIDKDIVYIEYIE